MFERINAIRPLKEIRQIKLLNWLKALIIVACVIVIVMSGVKFYRVLFPKPTIPIEKPEDKTDKEVKEIIKEIIIERETIKEVIKYEQEKVISDINALGADELVLRWNNRLGEYRRKQGK